MAAVILHQRNLLGEIIAVQARQQAQFDHDLETVADAHHQFAFVDEAAEIGAHVMPDAARENMAGGHVIAVGKPSDKHQGLEFMDPRGVGEQVIQMDELNAGARLLPGVAGLGLAVQTIACDNQNRYVFCRHNLIPPRTKFHAVFF